MESYILLVEDSENDLELTLRAFKKHNLANRIEVARDGEEALDFLMCRGKHSGRDKSDLPRVVLLDLKLPKVSGLEVLREIRDDPVIGNVPIVVLTSSKEAPDVKECYNLGVNSYIVKPVDFQSFVAAVAQLGIYWVIMNHVPGA